MILGLSALITGFFVTFNYLIKWEPKLAKIEDFVLKYAKYIGMGALFVGIWHFFNPDTNIITKNFNTQIIMHEKQAFISDIITSVLIFLGGINLFSKVLDFVKINEEKKSKFLGFIEKYKLFLGVGNLFFGLIHLITPGSILV